MTNSVKIHSNMDWQGERRINVPGWVAFFAGIVSFFVSFAVLVWVAINTGLIDLIGFRSEPKQPSWVIPVVFGVSIIEACLVARLVFRTMQSKLGSRSE